MSILTFSAGSGDCWGSAADDDFSSNGTFLWLGGTPSIDANPRTWIPFPSVNLPKGTPIISAVIKWVATLSRSETTVSVRIGCEAVDNAISTPTDENDLFTRAMTTNFLNTSLEAYTSGVQYSYDITSAVQEILNRAGWVYGNTLAVLVWDNGTITDKRRQVASVENSSLQEPILEITFDPYVPSGGMMM